MAAVTKAARADDTGGDRIDVDAERAEFLGQGAGVVNDLRIGNQSLNCSDSAIDTSLFASNQQRKNVIGVAVNGNIQMSIDVTTDAGSVLSGAFSCEAI